MNYRIENIIIIDGNVTVHGWVIPKDLDSKVSIYVNDSNGKTIDYKLTRIKRDDVTRTCLSRDNDDHNLGFNIEFPSVFNSDDNYYLFIESEGNVVKKLINKTVISDFNSANKGIIKKIKSSFNSNTFGNAIKYLFKNGIVEFVKKIVNKLKYDHDDFEYLEWYKLTKETDEYFDNQHKNIDFKIKPFLSIVIPIYDTDEKYLYLLFKSILAQTYQNFEVCVADATDYKKTRNNPKSFFDKLLDEKDPLGINKYAYDLKNLHVKSIDNKSIADNTNEAIGMSKGEYIVLCDHDDELTNDALYEVVKVINEHPEVKFIYSDEDKVDKFDDYYFEPNFKPDFNLDMLLSVNYFCHLSVIKKSLLDEIKVDGAYELKLYDGAQDYDLFLRVVSHIINSTYKDGRYDVSSIYHIRKVLYHWRWHELSTAKNVSSKTYAFDNAEKTLEKFYKESKINFPKVLKVEKGYDYGIYHTVYDKNYDESLVSIVIPNKDHVDDLDLAINSILKGSYRNVEIVICENNSTEENTFKYYDSLKSHTNIKVCKYEGSFNYSKINNFAVKYSTGDYILFLNNDVEMIAVDSIHEMLSYVRRSDVGAVGAKLLYKDDTYQHAGVVIGICGVADHSFKGKSKYNHTYMNRAELVQDYNAVTAACLMTKRSVFDEIGGFDEKIAVAFNDIDLCLRIRNAGYLVVYNPYSIFYHYESKSRGYEDTKEKVERFNKEFAFFVKRWNKKLLSLDEYYNPNLTLRKNDFSLRNLKYEKIGEPFPIPEEISILMSKINE